MNKGERIQWACGHWLVAGEYGIQDDSVKDVPTKRCGPCRDRLRDAAPQLLEALEEMSENSHACEQVLNREGGHLGEFSKCSMSDCTNARAAIELAKK